MTLDFCFCFCFFNVVKIQNLCSQERAKVDNVCLLCVRLHTKIWASSAPFNGVWPLLWVPKYPRWLSHPIEDASLWPYLPLQVPCFQESWHLEILADHAYDQVMKSFLKSALLEGPVWSICPFVRPAFLFVTASFHNYNGKGRGRRFPELLRATDVELIYFGTVTPRSLIRCKTSH